MASEWVSMEPATHGERFELRGWIQSRCCELSSMPINHLKCTCSVADKEFFKSRWSKKQKGARKNKCHNWLFPLKLYFCRTLAHGIYREMGLCRCFLMTKEENSKPGSPLHECTLTQSRPDCVYFFFPCDARSFSPMRKPDPFISRVSKETICWFDMLWQKGVCVFNF